MNWTELWLAAVDGRIAASWLVEKKDPSNSEVARLIKQSLEQDQRRAEAAKARELMQQLQNQSVEDEVMEPELDEEDQRTLANAQVFNVNRLLGV